VRSEWLTLHTRAKGSSRGAAAVNAVTVSLPVCSPRTVHSDRSFAPTNQSVRPACNSPCPGPEKPAIKPLPLLLTHVDAGPAPRGPCLPPKALYLSPPRAWVPRSAALCAPPIASGLNEGQKTGFIRLWGGQHVQGAQHVEEPPRDRGSRGASFPCPSCPSFVALQLARLLPRAQAPTLSKRRPSKRLRSPSSPKQSRSRVVRCEPPSNRDCPKPALVAFFGGGLLPP
jgi:hypothetical protein